MSDSLLWNGLASSSDVDALLSALADFAQLSVRRRAPVLARVLPLCGHDDARVRLAAVHAVAGACGHAAWCALVTALQDQSEPVRVAAVEALRESASMDGPRFAHVLFHANPEVRRQGAEGQLPPSAEQMLFYMLPDAATGQVCFERARMPSDGLHALLRFVDQGVLTAERARARVFDASVAELMDALEYGAARSHASIARLLCGGAPDDWGADVLDRLLDLHWCAAADRFFQEFRVAIRLEGRHALRVRYVASIVARIHLDGRCDARALAPVVELLPAVLDWPQIPLESRRSALRFLLQARSSWLADSVLQRMLVGPLVRDGRGRLSLVAVAALLRLRRGDPLKFLHRWLPPTEVIDACARNPAAAAVLFHAGTSKKRRDRWQQSIVEAHPSMEGPMLAVRILGGDPLLLATLDARRLSELAGPLLRISGSPELSLSDGDLGRLSETLARTLRPEHIEALVQAWLAQPNPITQRLGVRWFCALARRTLADTFALQLAKLKRKPLRALVRLVDQLTGVPHATERALQQVLADHDDPELRAWASKGQPSAKVAARPRAQALPRLSPGDRNHIATVSDAALGPALSPCLRRPRAGLSEALSSRGTPPTPHRAACVALLGCLDPAEQVATQFSRFASADERWLSSLDETVVSTWMGCTGLPLVGHAWLYCFERHRALATDLVASHDGGLTGGLRETLNWPAPVLTLQVWQAVVRTLASWRWRDPPRLAALCSPELVALMVEQLPGAAGDAAARGLSALFEAGLHLSTLAELRPRVESHLPELSERGRRALRPYVDASGVRSSSGRSQRRTLSDEERDSLSRTAQLDELERTCRGQDEALAEFAAECLLEHAEEGQLRLLDVLEADPPVRAVRPLAVRAVAGGLFQDLAQLAGSQDAPLETRFALCLALEAKQRGVWLPHALRHAAQEDDRAWFRRDDAEELAARHHPLTLALALHRSPHPHAYRPAVEVLLARPLDDDRAAACLRAFLDCRGERQQALRVRAAWRLFARAEAHGLPILLAEVLERRTPNDQERVLFEPFDAHTVVDAVRGVLAAGALPEAALVELLEAPGVDVDAQNGGFDAILRETRSAELARKAAAEVEHTAKRKRHCSELAKLFAWGARRGRELTGHRIRVHLTSGEALGYTRLTERSIYVSPRPLFTDTRHATQIVEGLILHELGHQRYHADTASIRAWDRACSEGLQHVLNLVADEHLERNLRALNADHGDRLKRLCAHAFQHADRDVHVMSLLSALGDRGFAVLTAARLGVSRQEGSVAVQSGQILHELERAGSSFARFARALRMGLGDRHGDPLVREALGWFGRDLRSRTMDDLLLLARKLRELFGLEVQLLDHLGSPEGLPATAGDELSEGDGLLDSEVQREVERVLEPPTPATSRDRKPGRLAINVNPNTEFEPIHTVVRVRRDPQAHAELTAELRVPIRRMRRYFERLGLGFQKERARLSGRQFDTTRTLAVVTRSDPRMLVARRVVRATDLFLGVVIDCSGSMAGESLERARRFGVLLAEACRGAPGVEMRALGFDDRTIYDAGDAQRCSVAALEVGGGNNDAAALQYAARLARGSRRRARLLVMISDGLPTECSTAALSALVTRLTRREGTLCAQVAVRPLEEECFPHYVEIDDEDLQHAVSRFGNIVQRLVGEAMGR